jgi:hypothetical protein
LAALEEKKTRVRPCENVPEPSISHGTFARLALVGSGADRKPWEENKRQILCSLGPGRRR